MPGAAAPAFKTKFLVIVLVFVQGYIFPPGVRLVDTSVLGLRSEWEGTLFVRGLPGDSSFHRPGSPRRWAFVVRRPLVCFPTTRQLRAKINT